MSLEFSAGLQAPSGTSDTPPVHSFLAASLPVYCPRQREGQAKSGVTQQVEWLSRPEGSPNTNLSVGVAVG